MVSVNGFRAVVIISLFSYMVWYFYPFLGGQNSEMISLARYRGYGAIFNPPLFLHWMIFSLWVIASLGLLFFQKWAKFLYVVLVVYSYATTPFYGLSIDSAAGAFFRDIVIFLDGIIIISIFRDPLRKHFE